MQAAVIVAPRRAQCRSAVGRVARRPALASAASSGPGILNPMAGTTTQSGALRADRGNGNAEALRGLDRLPDADDAHVESRHREPGHLDQLVRRLEGVEDGREAEVEHAVEREDVDAHGKNDIKDGVLANWPLRCDRAIVGSCRGDSRETQPCPLIAMKTVPQRNILQSHRRHLARALAQHRADPTAPASC